MSDDDDGGGLLVEYEVPAGGEGISKVLPKGATASAAAADGEAAGAAAGGGAGGEEAEEAERFHDYHVNTDTAKAMMGALPVRGRGACAPSAFSFLLRFQLSAFRFFGCLLRFQVSAFKFLKTRF